MIKKAYTDLKNKILTNIYLLLYPDEIIELESLYSNHKGMFNMETLSIEAGLRSESTSPTVQ